MLFSASSRYTEGNIGPECDIYSDGCDFWGAEGSGKDLGGEEDEMEVEDEDDASCFGASDASSFGGWRLDISSPSSANKAIIFPILTFFVPSGT